MNSLFQLRCRAETPFEHLSGYRTKRRRFKSGGGGTNTVVQNSQPPQSVMDAYNNVIGASQQQAQQPLQQYTGPMVAGFTPDQLSAMQTVDNAQGIANPYINAAAGLTSAGATPIAPTQFSADAVNQYQSPYTQSVVQATENQFNNQNAQQQQQLEGNAISKGAWGGDRAGVAQAVLAGQQQLSEAPTIAGLQNQGYAQALQEFNAQQQQDVGAQEASGWLAENAGFGMGSLGNEAQNAALSGASAQLSSGAQQQQLGQEQLNIPYEMYQQQQAYPYQQIGWEAGIAEGLGSAAGGTSSTQYPGASSLSQAAGLGMTGLGAAGLAYNAFGGSGTPTASPPTTYDQGYASLENQGYMPNYARGGAVAAPRQHRALGGSLSPFGSSGSVSTTTQNQQFSPTAALSDVMGAASLGKTISSAWPGITHAASWLGNTLGLTSSAADAAGTAASTGEAGAAMDLAGGALATAGTAAAIDAAAGGLGAASAADAIASAAPLLLAAARGGRIQRDTGGAIFAPPPLPTVPNVDDDKTIKPPTFQHQGAGPPKAPAPGQQDDPAAQGAQSLQMAGAIGGLLKKSDDDKTDDSKAYGGRIYAADGGAMAAPAQAPMPTGQATQGGYRWDITPAMSSPSQAPTNGGPMPFQNTPAQPAATGSGSPAIAGYTQGPHGISVPVLGMPQQGQQSLNIAPTSNYSPPSSAQVAAMGGAGIGGQPAPPGPPAPINLGSGVDGQILQALYNAYGGPTDGQPGHGTYEWGGQTYNVATGGRIGRDVGGPTMAAGAESTGQSGGTMQEQNLYKQFAALPPEKLQELSVRLPASSAQGQAVRKALSVKQMNPAAAAQKQQGMTAPPGAVATGVNMLNPTAGAQQQQQQQQPMMAFGGRAGYGDGGPVPITPPDSFATLMKHAPFSTAVRHGVPGGVPIRGTPEPANGKAYGGRAGYDDGGDVAPYVSPAADVDSYGKVPSDQPSYVDQFGRLISAITPPPPGMRTVERQPAPLSKVGDAIAAVARPTARAAKDIASKAQDAWSSYTADDHAAPPTEDLDPATGLPLASGRGYGPMVRGIGDALGRVGDRILKAGESGYTPEGGSESYPASTQEESAWNHALSEDYGGRASDIPYNPNGVSPGGGQTYEPAMGAPPPPPEPSEADLVFGNGPLHDASPEAADAATATGATAESAGTSVENSIPDEKPSRPSKRAPSRAHGSAASLAAPPPAAALAAPSDSITPYQTTPLDPVKPTKEAPQPSAIAKIANSPWLPLVIAGAQTMAGRSPYALANLGQGIEAGTKTVQQQQASEQATQKLADEKAYREGDLDYKAKQLSELANYHNKQDARASKQEQDTAADRREQRALESQRIAMEQNWHDATAGQGRFSYIGNNEDPNEPGAVLLDQRTGNTEVRPYKIAPKTAGAQSMLLRQNLAPTLYPNDPAAQSDFIAGRRSATQYEMQKAAVAQASLDFARDSANAPGSIKDPDAYRAQHTAAYLRQFAPGAAVAPAQAPQQAPLGTRENPMVPRTQKDIDDAPSGTIIQTPGGLRVKP